MLKPFEPIRRVDSDLGIRPRTGSGAPAPTPASLAPQGPAEFDELQRVLGEAGDGVDIRQVCSIRAGRRQFPIQVITLGNPSLDVPAVGFFAGVHGLERIGTSVITAYLRSLLVRLKWDHDLQRQLETLRLVFMPIVNPGGLWLGTRANPNGVDLMRNAPVESSERVPFLLGGHRISPRLPWYRGKAQAPMEEESQALSDVVQQELLSRRFSIAVDCHSGFGLQDRIWFPNAHTSKPIEHLSEIAALTEIFEQTLPNHDYVIEPQSKQYLTHGDLWDHLYQQAQTKPDCTLLPFTLELGSWSWVRKNPRQLFSRQGLFNPIAKHREQRVLRRHMAWLDFVTHAAGSHANWLCSGDNRSAHLSKALARWYR